MIGEFDRFDMKRRPNRQWAVLLPIVWLLSFPKTWLHRARIDKSALPKGLKPPYFLLCNHNSFMDFMNMSRAVFPFRANYVVAIDGYIGREWLLRAVGAICTRKFTTDITLVKNMLRARDLGDVVVLFPEARYSLCGTQAPLPDSLGKMIRKMGLPVVTLLMHGHHVNAPFWNVKSRGARPVESEMKLLFTAEETRELALDEMNQRLAETFKYDDFRWQREKGVRIARKNRAEGLHKVLYQCPACNTEYEMRSSGSALECGHCGRRWQMSELGELRAEQGETEFPHIPDWYEWQRGNVRREVVSGAYSFESAVRIESLPNARGFITFDEPGTLVHNAEGFTLSGALDGKSFSLHWPAKTLYSCHIEYDYKKRGDCVDLNTPDDTFYLYPSADKFSVTKLSLATEELYKHQSRK
jgi:1-acyl-sn-glycerol-3-phosphate acyltransferase